MTLPQVLSLCDLSAAAPAEHINILASGTRFRFEHILSGSHTSPVNFCYEQPQAEWAILLAGSAALEFEEGVVTMKAGEAVLIPAHLKHRVVSSSEAVWLALHFDD